MADKRVLSVGQCAPDQSALSTKLTGLGAAVDTSTTIQGALEELSRTRYDLVLVNRILDATDEEGVELVRRMKDSPYLRDTPVMLVSNFDSAQTEAESVGAVRGFGKGALDEPATVALLSEYLA